MQKTPEQKAAARSAWLVVAAAITSRQPFSDRGFSERTVKVLLARGVDAPERLLFASEADLKKIPGIGKAGFDEIMRYRDRFLDATAMIGGDEDQ